MDDKNLTQDNNNRRTISAAIIGGAIIALLLIASTLWINRTDEESTAQTVHSVSELYLRELIARREQIITSRIDARTKNLNNALRVLSSNDLSDVNALQSYLERMRITYAVDQFGFIDTTGNIYTPQGMNKDTAEYFFADEEITDTKIFTEITSATDKNITLAVPVENVSFGGTPIKAVFLQLTISKFFEGVMMHTTNSEMTFFNLYYTNGESLTSAVLGEFKNGTNIVEALDGATFSDGYSKNKIIEDFAAEREGVSVFTYHGVKEMLYYRPLTKAGWILTYMIRENQVAERISEVSTEMRHRSMFQIVLTILSMLIVFALIILQARKNADLLHQKSLTEAESRIKSEEMEEKLRLQTQLLTEERRRRRQSEMIQALTVDYRLVYHLILDTDEAVCYRATPEITAKLNRKQSDIVKFQEAMKNYIDNYVASTDRKELLEFIKPENIRARLAKEEMISQRYLTHYNGEEYFMMLRIAKIDDEMHAVGVGFANVDEQTRASFARNQELADALAQAQHANVSKTVFLSNMSHDIRTPMNAIIGFTNLALRHFDNRTQVKDSLEKVLSSSNHLLGLINDILDMSRIESGRIEVNEQECNLSDLIHSLIHLIQPQITAKQQQFHIDAFKVKDEDVYADQLKVNQVLINILSNAVKYTPATGSIFFRISQYESDKPGCARYEFRVKDNGLGMSKEFLKHVFDAFEREETSTKSGIQGTGLGMSITKKMVELMGGTIDVESEKDKGSEFTVTLDFRIQKDVIPVQVPELKNMRVLIVDDDFNNCESVNEMLKQVGMRSEWTTSPREAVFRAGRALDEDPFDLYIIDWLMPGQNGTETVRQIRRVVGDSVPIIILTAYDYSDVESEGKAAGVTTFCTKPLFMSDLKSAFKRALCENEETDNQQDEIALTDFGGKRVLLVEDIEVNREIAKAVLEEIGFEVEDADDGTVAVDMVKNAPLNHYDIILMDVQMPKMNGYDATRAIRALNRQDAKTVPIVAMTANAFEEDKANAINAGMNDHLAKPLDISKLIATLNKYLS
ncbi:MAG: response regulator [Selenomonadaceae bacterium]|nr:response regulator [Selenomonadaceae bacterium]